MPIRSMTGYAQLKAESNGLAYTLSLKSVNHRFLDLHLRLPGGTDALEMKLRRALKERLLRGHVELTLSLEKGVAAAAVNQELLATYIRAFRAAAAEYQLDGEPDLNAILRIPGALTGSSATLDEAAEAAILSQLDELVAKLNHMREEEGRGIDRELRERMEHLSAATEEIGRLRPQISRAYKEKVQSRMEELIGSKAEPERILQEAALLAERSDIQEEIVRLKTHIAHFIGLLDQGGEVGKKLDFLLQEFNREANTLLSKTTGVSGEGVRITELGLALKSEIEKTREQVQNIE